MVNSLLLAFFLIQDFNMDAIVNEKVEKRNETIKVMIVEDGDTVNDPKFEIILGASTYNNGSLPTVDDMINAQNNSCSVRFGLDFDKHRHYTSLYDDYLLFDKDLILKSKKPLIIYFEIFTEKEILERYYKELDCNQGFIFENIECFPCVIISCTYCEPRSMRKSY